MIRFVMSVDGQIISEPVLPISGRGKFITLPTGEFVFSNLNAHDSIFFKYVELVKMDDREMYRLFQNKENELAGGRWEVEIVTLRLFGYSESFGPFDRTRSRSMVDELKSTFGVERVMIEDLG